MSQRRLTIYSDEAVDRAAELARRLGRDPADIVVDALRLFDRQIAARPVSDGAGEPDDFLDFVRTLRPIIGEGATSRHDDLYDESGLPR